MGLTCQPIILRWPQMIATVCTSLKFHNIEFSLYARHHTKHRSADGCCPLGLQTKLIKMTATWISSEVNYWQVLLTM